MTSASIVYKSYKRTKAAAAAATPAQAAAALKPPQPVGGNTPPSRLPMTVGPTQQNVQLPGQAAPTDPNDTTAAAAAAKQQAEQEQQMEQLNELTTQNQQLTAQVQKLEIEKDLEKQKGQLHLLAGKAQGGSKAAPKASPGSTGNILKGHVTRMRRSIPKVAHVLVLAPGLVKYAVDPVAPQITPGQTPPVTTPAPTPEVLPPIAKGNPVQQGFRQRTSWFDDALKQSPTWHQDQQTAVNKQEDEWVGQHRNDLEKSWGQWGVGKGQARPGDTNVLGTVAGRGADAVRNWWYGTHGIEDTQAQAKDTAHSFLREAVAPFRRAGDNAYGLVDDNRNMFKNLWQTGKSLVGQNARGFAPLNTQWWSQDVGAPLAEAASNFTSATGHAAGAVGNAVHGGLNVGLAPGMGALGWLGKTAPALVGGGISMAQGDDVNKTPEQIAAENKAQLAKLEGLVPSTPAPGGFASPAAGSGSIADWNPAQALNDYGYQGFGEQPWSQEYLSRYRYQDPRMEKLMNQTLPMLGYGATMFGLPNVVDPSPDHAAFAAERPAIDPRIAQLLPMLRNLNQYPAY